MPFTVTPTLLLLLRIVAPAPVMLVVAVVVWKLLTDARWVFGPLVAVSFGLAYWNLEPKVDWPPTGNVLYLLFYFPLLFGVLTFADAVLKPPLWLRAIVLAISWRIAVRLLLQRQVPDSITPTSAEMWIDLSTLLAVGWWLAFEMMAERWSGVTVSILLAALSLAGAIFLAMGWHIQSSGALAGALMGMCVAVGVVSLIAKRTSLSRGFAQMAVLILQLLLVHGYFYTDDTLTNQQEALAALLMVCPFLAFAGELPGIPRRALWQIGVRLAPVVIVLGILCAVTIRDYVHAEETGAAAEQ